MKFKFFITIFLALLLTAISISAIHFHFFRLERMRLIELNLQQNATLILDSDLTLSKKEFLRAGPDYISNIIGDDKVNILVSIYNEDGSLLYENENASVFDTPRKLQGKIHEWEDVENHEYLIKYLTRVDPEQKRIVKVGMVLNQSLLRWKYLSQRLAAYGALVLAFITIISFFLTTLLFRPVHKLAEHVNEMAEKLETGNTDDFQILFAKSSTRFQDEFSALLQAIRKLALKISESHNITKRWSALMAHELKTPLTILKNKVESLSFEEATNKKKIAEIDEEMTRVEHIIQDFLEWASLENDPNRPEIHAVSMAKRCDYVIRTFKEAFPGTELIFENEFGPDAKVFCHPIHFDQLFGNLLSNAAKYGGSRIVVKGTDQSITIKDNGPGIPADILSRIGTPFNHSRINAQRGFGLGLAWVNTICKKYGWSLHIENHDGAKITVSFPDLT